jgi:hypothetical protein
VSKNIKHTPEMMRLLDNMKFWSKGLHGLRRGKKIVPPEAPAPEIKPPLGHTSSSKRNHSDR